MYYCSLLAEIAQFATSTLTILTNVSFSLLGHNSLLAAAIQHGSNLLNLWNLLAFWLVELLCDFWFNSIWPIFVVAGLFHGCPWCNMLMGSSKRINSKRNRKDVARNSACLMEHQSTNEMRAKRSANCPCQTLDGYTIDCFTLANKSNWWWCFEIDVSLSFLFV